MYLKSIDYFNFLLSIRIQRIAIVSSAIILISMLLIFTARD